MCNKLLQKTRLFNVNLDHSLFFSPRLSFMLQHKKKHIFVYIYIYINILFPCKSIQKSIYWSYDPLAQVALPSLHDH